LFRSRKYVLDMTDLQYKQVRLPWKKKLIRLLLWFTGSIIITVIYIAVFDHYFGSPKEKMLVQEVENVKLQYTLIGRQLDYSMKKLNSFRRSDDIRYRPILDMDSIPESIRRGGYGGVDRFRSLTGYMNSNLLIATRSKIEEIKNMANVQRESFISVGERYSEWKREMDHFPGISPVSVKYRLGDGYTFREVHPVLGTPRWHYGQDFKVPHGTEVYATGDGTVIESGWSSGGFGNYVKIDHGYGLQTVYGHLSQIKVAKGMNVKRCDIIGLSGSTGTSSGPHLHYEIYQFGKHKNPLYFFNNDITNEEFDEMIQAFGSKSMFR
jgi:murein DD-endopeptidase MepM/ murein hydrolase activator NlpD